MLVVWRSDRLFRSLQHMVNCLAELEARRIHFVSATEIFDTTTPQGKLLFHLVSAFAEFERQVLISRTRAGIEAARRRGAVIGRPRVALDVAKAHQLRSGGASYRDIASQLGVSVGKLHGALRASGGRVQKP